MCAIYGETAPEGKEIGMPEDNKQERPSANLGRTTDHPWVDLPLEDDSIGESVRYSLDEIRYA